MFDAVDGVVISLSARLPTAVSASGKVFPSKFEPMPTGKQPVAVVHPVSQFGRHCCPGVSKPVPADGGSS